MKLSKEQKRALSIMIILFISFNVVVFAFPFSLSTVFWVAYAFAVLSILAQIPIMRIAFKSGKDAKSRFYGFPIARLGVTYLCVQLSASLIVMTLSAWFPFSLEIVVFILIVAVSAVGLITADTVRDDIERQDAKLKANVAIMRTLQSKAAFIAGQCDDPTAQKSLQKLSDTFRYSDPVSSPATTETERDLVAYMEELQNAVVERDYANILTLCSRVETTLAERNRICKVSK